MKNRIQILTMSGFMLSAALIVIQIYFLRNTYHLYQRQTLSEIKESLTELSGRLNIDSLRSAKIDELSLSILASTNKGSTPKINSASDSVSTSRVSDLLHSNDLLSAFDVHVVARIKDISYWDEPHGYSVVLSRDINWFGNYGQLEEKNILSEHTLTRTYNFMQGRPISVTLNTEMLFSVNNWQNLLLKKLITWILLSTLLVLAVIVLFYLSIKNLIQQKKIAEIKTDFVNNITHEFNTPLATLDIATATLKELGNNMSNEIKAVMNTIDRQSKRLNFLVKQAITFSQGEKKIVLNKSEIDTRKFLTEIVSEFQKTNPAISIKLSHPESHTVASIDAHLITTAIQNLLENAVKFGSNTIQIESFKMDKVLTISVEDNGKGIPADKHHLIFDKFHKLETGDLHNSKGLGLGLYYVKQISKAHNGNITVRSIPNISTVFTITVQTE